MRKIFILMAVCLVVAVLSSCQLLRDNRKQQTIYVITSPTGASCQLSNDKGVWKVDATPQTIKIVRSMYGLTVICRKPGYVATTGVVTAKAKNVYLTSEPLKGFAQIQTPKTTYVYPPQVSVTLNRAQNDNAPQMYTASPSNHIADDNPVH